MNIKALIIPNDKRVWFEKCKHEEMALWMHNEVIFGD